MQQYLQHRYSFTFFHCKYVMNFLRRAIRIIHVVTSRSEFKLKLLCIGNGKNKCTLTFLLTGEVCVRIWVLDCSASVPLHEINFQYLLFLPLHFVQVPEYICSGCFQVRDCPDYVTLSRSGLMSKKIPDKGPICLSSPDVY